MIVLSPDNRENLENLNWMLEASRGEFILAIAVCNYGNLQQAAIAELVRMSALAVRVVKLQETDISLFDALRRELSDIAIAESAVMVTGWERVEQLEKLLASANQVRESLNADFPIPMVFWVTHEVLKTLLKSAPDLASWASNYQFRLPSAAVNEWLAERVQQVRSHGDILTPEAAKALRGELEAMQREMDEEEEVALSAEGRAHRETLWGIACVPYGDNRQLQEAVAHYRAALEIWEEQGNLEEQGYLYSRLAYAYFRLAFPTRENVQYVPPKLFEELIAEQRCEGSEWQVAYDYVRRTLALWEEAGKLENLAGTFHRWLGLLRYLQHWEMLAQLAERVIPLHEDEEKWPKNYLLRDYSVLAEGAFARKQWKEAEQWSEKVLQGVSGESNRYYVALSRLILAKVYRDRNQKDRAIAQLQQVRESGVERSPRLHVESLQLLRDLLFDRKDYLEAYEVKRELRTAEFDYNFRGFIGASRLKPRPQQRGVAPEIRAAGREPAVEELVERILNTSHVVTVIYGYSGVGKSSLLQAGLVPALEATIHRDRILPILLRRYEDWQGRIGRQLERFGLDPSTPLGAQWTEADLLEVWREADRSHQRIVLILDQFEEFFFRFPMKQEQKQLFRLLSQGLEQCPALQVVISIRQDFIHYLFPQRELQRAGDMLSPGNTYPLSYFQPQEAVQIMQRLTEPTSFHPEEELLQQLVKDLAGDAEEVIPIELQIVGSQLEDSYITRLQEYSRLHEGALEPKTELVRRYIQTIVQDCGMEHQESAYWLLFLLTDENLRRPVKTEQELQRELRQKIEKADLPLVLKILVGSGLVLLIEERGEECYQLVHDYLVRYVREKEPELRQLQEKLEREQAKRQVAERSLAEIEKKVRRSRWQLGLTSVASAAILVVTFGLFRQARIERQLALDGTRWERLGVRAIEQFEDNGEQLETLVSALQTAQELHPHTANQPITEYAAYRPISALQQITQIIREQNKIPHQDEVWDVEFSPDGRYLATGSDDNTAKIVEVESGKTLHTITHQERVMGVAFSPDGRYLATGSEDKTAKITEVESGETLHTITHQERVMGVAFSPDGRYLATGSEDKTAKITEVESGKTLHTITHQNLVWRVEFSPDGRYLATGSTDKTAKIVEVESGETLHAITHQDWVSKVAFSPDGRYLATGSEDKTAKITEVESGKTLHTITHQAEVWGVAFSPDGRYLATGSADNKVQIAAVKSWQTLHTINHEGEVWGVTFSSDGRYLATGSSNNTAKITAVKSWQTLHSITHQGTVREVEFSPKGRYLATSSSDKTAKIVEIESRQTLQTITHQDSVWAVDFSSNGRYLATGSKDKTAKITEIESGQTLQTITHEDKVRAVDFSSNGRYLATSSSDKTAKITEVESGTTLHAITHQDTVWEVEFSPNGRYLATGSRDKTAKITEVESGTTLHTITHEDTVWKVEFSPNGRYLATGSDDNTAKITEVESGKTLHAITHKGKLEAVVFSPDGRYLATGSDDNTAKITEVESGKTLHAIPHEDKVWGVEFSPNGRYLATYSNNTIAKITAVESGQTAALQGHSDDVTDVAWSSDGDRIATGSRDSAVRLWTKTGQELAVFEGHQGWVGLMRWDEEGREITSVAVDGNTVTVMKSPVETLEELIARGCRWVRPYLTSNNKQIEGCEQYWE
ncbi:hypothetical protein [Roseofilum casamattae]|uniref:Novel STAND NTPase 1 domain-containing protein n=1 Tax=Roseofilum casamattae BLCC-M143 TaxID=3022442 RepID=A0ABT7BSG4_9CYAN|nr:hypothetical protein [Roseofilum casamattae]MDJ1182133.1 hypothetical protein [Roseofilum casamattae BLCC-M143]